MEVIGARNGQGATFTVVLDGGEPTDGTSFTSDNQGRKQEAERLFLRQGLSNTQHVLAVTHTGKKGQAIDIDRFFVSQAPT